MSRWTPTEKILAVILALVILWCLYKTWENPRHASSQDVAPANQAPSR